MKLLLFIATLLVPLYAGQTNEAGVEQGKALFRSNCAFCHGLTAQGGRGPNLISSSLLKSSSDEGLRTIIKSGVSGTTMPAFDLPKDDLENLVAFLHSLSGGHTENKVDGDAKAGEQIYARSGCSNCHRIGDTGSIYGPELTRIGAGRSVEYLRESMIDPSADIADNYGGVTVVTKDGKRVSGVRVNEDTFTVQIRKPDQTFAMFDKSEAKEVVHETKSMMPAYKQLSPADLQNLIAYLVTLRGQHAVGGEATKAEGIR
jgi:putative heme-binding domain-containing protein